MVKKTPSETTRPSKKAPSAYQEVKHNLRELTRYIGAHKFGYALYYSREFRSAVQQYLVNTGMDFSDVTHTIDHLQMDIINQKRSEYLKRRKCMSRLNEIVNMLPDYGLYLGQHVQQDENGEGNPLDVLYRLNASLDNLCLHFTEQSISKEEMNSALKQLQRAVSRYQPQGKEMQVLRRYLLRCISDTVGEMNSVNTENPGKMTFQSFSRSAAELQHALNGFLLARDDPIHRQLFLKEVMEHEATGDEETAADYYASLTEDSEVREAFRQLFDEFMDEREN